MQRRWLNIYLYIYVILVHSLLTWLNLNGMEYPTKVDKIYYDLEAFVMWQFYPGKKHPKNYPNRTIEIEITAIILYSQII